MAFFWRVMGVWGMNWCRFMGGILHDKRVECFDVLNYTCYVWRTLVSKRMYLQGQVKEMPLHRQWGGQTAKVCIGSF